LLAIANEAKLSLSIDDFDRISSKVPLLPISNPEDVLSQPISTQQAALRSSQSAWLKLDCSAAIVSPSLDAPSPGSRRRQGNAIAGSCPQTRRAAQGDRRARHPQGKSRPEGCVIKVAGHNIQNFRGPARVFDNEKAAFAAVENSTIKSGDVVVIRYERPERRPGHA